MQSRFVENTEVNEIYKKLHPRHGGKKDHYFGVAYISKKFKIPADEAISYISFDDNDYGIDGFYHDINTKNLYLFQFRWSEDHLSFKNSLNILVNKGLEKIFTHENNKDQMIIRLKTSIAENQNLIDRILFHFIFNGNPARAEQSKVLDLLKETLESRKHVIDTYFGRQIGMISQFLSNEKTLGHPFIRKQSATYTINFENSLKTSDDGNELIVTFMSLGSLYHMYRDLGERFFEKNIRSGLDEGKMTNKEIKNSLKKIILNEEPSQRFTFYHNGVALTAEALEFQGTTLKLIEPRILNGAQTVKTVKQFVDENKQQEVARNRLNNVRVIARIVKSKEEEFLKRVTINNNRQNPIMPWNLRANDLVQLHFEEVFRDKLGIYYERRENAFGNLAEQELEELSITNKRAIEIKKFAQTLLAMQGEVDRISDIREVFENERWYKETFKERYLEVDPRKFVLLYKINYRLPSIIREIQNIGSEKYEYMGRARNLLWALTIQAVLNDPKFDVYVDRFGDSLIMEADFNNMLKDMASSRVRFIIRDTFADTKYRKYLEQTKYSFLRTKSTYNDCIDTAKKQFGWEKKHL